MASLNVAISKYATLYNRHRRIFDRNNVSIPRLIAKFEETDSITGNVKSPVRPRSRHSLENITAVRVNYRSQELNVSRSSLERNLTKDLHMPTRSNSRKNSNQQTILHEEKLLIGLMEEVVNDDFAKKKPF